MRQLMIFLITFLNGLACTTVELKDMGATEFGFELLVNDYIAKSAPDIVDDFGPPTGIRRTRSGEVYIYESHEDFSVAKNGSSVPFGDGTCSIYFAFRNEKVSRVKWKGNNCIYTEPASPALGVVYGQRKRGVVITEFSLLSPGESHGLQKHDLILSVNGNRAASIFQIKKALARTKPGQDVVFEVKNGDRVRKVSIPMAGAPFSF